MTWEYGKLTRDRLSIGERFGRLVVIDKAEKYKYWKCVCDCGELKSVRQDAMPDEGDTLERISVQGNYEPENCKWEPSLSVQGFNKRLKSTNTSGKTGVRKTKVGTWQAYIQKAGKFHDLGSYKNFDDAVKARREGELKHYGFYQEDV